MFLSGVKLEKSVDVSTIFGIIPIDATDDINIWANSVNWQFCDYSSKTLEYDVKRGKNIPSFVFEHCAKKYHKFDKSNIGKKHTCLTIQNLMV